MKEASNKKIKFWSNNT